MKRFTVPCDFGGQKHPFHVYIGEPHPKKHPLQNQAWWLSNERGGTIPQDVMDSFEKLFKISQENNVSFEDLCVYALGTASKDGKTGAAPATGAQPPAGGGAAGGGATGGAAGAPASAAAKPAGAPAGGAAGVASATGAATDNKIPP
ncbi:MAG: hypothetical protein CMM94_00820, partial [Rickettsiales bacterium]|nr:hypothetical protein [Rickettsiales bacterium]